MNHDIDIILNLIKSKVVKVHVLGSSVFSDKDDLVNAQLKFENGCIANIIASRASQNQVRTLSVTQKDSLRYKQESLVERIFVHKENPLKLELQHFLDCATNGSPRKVAIDNELYSLKIALDILSQFENSFRK